MQEDQRVCNGVRYVLPWLGKWRAHVQRLRCIWRVAPAGSRAGGKLSGILLAHLQTWNMSDVASCLLMISLPGVRMLAG